MAASATSDRSRSALLPSTQANSSEQPAGQFLSTDSAYNDIATLKKGQAVTFGLELEFNMAFTDQSLVRVLNTCNFNHTHIQRKHSDLAHSSLLAAEDYSKTCRSRYPSWGVAIPLDVDDPYTSPMLTSSTYNTACEQTGRLFRVRSYITEPLFLAQSLMKQRNLQADIRAIIRDLGNNQPGIPLPGSGSSGDYLLCHSADHSKWTLTNDHTLIGSLKAQLKSKLPSKITASNVND